MANMFEKAAGYLNAIGHIATDTKTGYKLKVTGVEFHIVRKLIEGKEVDEECVLLHVAGEVEDVTVKADIDDFEDDGLLLAQAKGRLTVRGMLPWSRLSFEQQR